MSSFYEMAGHFVKDLGRLLSNPKSVSKEEYRRRLNICDVCPHRRGNRCGLCGCNLALRATKQAWTCDAGHWDGVPFEATEAQTVDEVHEFTVDSTTGCVTGDVIVPSGKCPGWDTCSLRRIKTIQKGNVVRVIPICSLEGKYGEEVSGSKCVGCEKAVRS